MTGGVRKEPPGLGTEDCSCHTGRACTCPQLKPSHANPGPLSASRSLLEEKAELGGSRSTDGAHRTRGCSGGSWDALLEGQEGPWARLAASSRDHFQLSEHLIFDPVCSTATGTAWLCVHTWAAESQRCHPEVPGATRAFHLPEFCLNLPAGASAAAHPGPHQSRALHFTPLLAPYRA